MARSSTTFTSKTAPRKGGKAGRRAVKTIFREYVKLAAGAEGIDPKAFMLGIVGDDEMPTDMRLMAARDVIPYTHKKMPQAVELDANVKIRSGFAAAVAADDGPLVPPPPPLKDPEA